MVNLDEIYDCEACEYRECFDCPKEIDSLVQIYTVGGSDNSEDEE